MKEGKGGFSIMAYKKRCTNRKKRTLSQEQIAKMQEGKRRKQVHTQRMAGIADLEKQLRKHGM